MDFQEKKINNGLIHTNKDCRGCNKCLNTCPVDDANIARDEQGQNKILVDQDYCILCGRCIRHCPHEARSYTDDTGRFFAALPASLRTGSRRISLVVAPSFAINYPSRYRHILGYLKHLGINHIYNVGFGADISVWGYLQYLTETKRRGMIAQPCPAIVRYIETYRPQLLDRLMPIHSPVMCTAIYLKKYMNLDDEIAFLGPCIAKKSEFERPENAGIVQYNITYEQLMQHIAKTDISAYDSDDSELDFGLGAVFPMHGGMRENIEFYMGLDKEAYINQKEGEDQSYSYLDFYANRIDYDDPCRGRLIDIVNCERGCNYGTATEFKSSPSNHIPYSMNQMRVEKRLMESLDFITPAERMEWLNERFRDLNLADFIAEYNDRSTSRKPVSQQQINEVFKEMLKWTASEQTVDCSACGMHSCHHMAEAIAKGYNYKENCVQYIKKRLIMEESEALIQRQKYELLQEFHRESASVNADQLTGLGNRYEFERRMEASMSIANMSGINGYVVLMDIDDFKVINDCYGSEIGNALLSHFAMYLREHFEGKADLFRIGGDEFLLLMSNCTYTDVRAVTDQVLRRAQEVWEILGQSFYCTFSIGTARFPELDKSSNDIMQQAELAMYMAKREGKNTCCFYSQELASGSHDQLDVIRGMRDAVADDFKDFHLHFQPWVTLDGDIIGCEALLRWNYHGTPLSPGIFIPIAEEIGYIVALGDFVLREAAKACREFNQINPDFTISVNVSPLQLKQKGVLERFINILDASGVNHKNIILEITESVQLEDEEGGGALLRQFDANGLKVALDDFGTGYSSLSYLNQFPFEIVKMDRSFIKDISDRYSGYMLEVMSDLMHKMNRRICVEGVETVEQLDFCKKHAVDIIQGFYFYKPMPAGDLISLIH